MFLALLCGAVSGLALFFSGSPLKCWPLVLVGLLPWIFVLEAMSAASAAVASVALAICYLAPLLRVLQFPRVMALGLGTWQALIWLLLSLGGHQILANSAPGAPIVFACLAALLSWLDYSIVPAFGTAQCFARVLTKAPRLIQFARVTGMPGLAFAVVAIQAFMARLVTNPESLTAAFLIFLLLILGISNEIIWRQPSVGSVKVAAMGWAGSRDNQTLIRTEFPRYLAEAAAVGARLVVSPEAQFAVENRALWLQQLAVFATEHNLSLAVGYFNMAADDNRIAFISPAGELQAEYAKTHLVPFFENYTAGEGRRAKVSLEEWDLGGVICQDDNFTDITRAYGRDQVHLLAVPTHDWHAVKYFHLENTRLRAIENGFALVRAASHGVSAIISSRGEILRQLDHYRGGDGLITAEIPLRTGTTLYAHLGDWFIPLSALALTAWTILAH